MIVMAALAIYPDLKLWFARGSAWNGSYFVSNYDEVAYSAYINTLIDGRPRKTDPFLTDKQSSPQPETFYSIQFIPAYAIALPAKAFGLTTSSAFIILILLTAVLSALAVFSFLYRVTEDKLVSAVGVLIILCLGALAAFQGQLSFWLHGRAVCDFFPFLRRYQPGFAFPLFFVFCLAVWQNLMENDWKKRSMYSLLGGLILAILIFSYFYLWTAAAAWLVCFTGVCVMSRTLRRRAVLNMGIIGMVGGAVSVPYASMLADRPANLDIVQILSHTRTPSVASVTMVFGLIIGAAILLTAWKGRIRLGAPQTLLAISFSLTPLILFNQQILTGRSLQPIHYEIFISNYLVLTALTLFISITCQSNAKRSIVRRALLFTAAFTVVWGVIEGTGSIDRYLTAAILRDESIPAISYVAQENRKKSTNGQLAEKPAVVLATNFVTSDFIPSASVLPILWSPHKMSAGGISLAENKRLFYLYLFYSGFNENDLAVALRRNVFEVTAALFGSDRALPALGHNTEQISDQELRQEIQDYAKFVKDFDKENAVGPLLSYLIVPERPQPNFSNVDRWYERDEGKTLGQFRVYRVKLRT